MTNGDEGAVFFCIFYLVRSDSRAGCLAQRCHRHTVRIRMLTMVFVDCGGAVGLGRGIWVGGVVVVVRGERGAGRRVCAKRNGHEESPASLEPTHPAREDDSTRRRHGVVTNVAHERGRHGRPYWEAFLVARPVSIFGPEVHCGFFQWSGVKRPGRRGLCGRP